MSYYHQIHTIADEETLIKKIIDLETQVRAQRERSRVTKNSENEKYSRIFEPITKTMKTLNDLSPPTTHEVTEHPNLITFTEKNNEMMNLPPPTIQPSSKEEEEEEDIKHTLSPHKQHSPVQRALSDIRKRARDDGIYGLNWETKKIGGRPFTVHHNALHVTEQDGSEITFSIDDENVWKLLLAQSPQSLRIPLKNERGEDTTAVKQYREIAKKLNLIAYAREHLKRGYNTRHKYKLIQPPAGSGFLFSTRKPAFINKTIKKQHTSAVKKVTSKKAIRKRKDFKPSTLVIPSDKAGLLRALVKALAEMRAGNSSMRNLVVPLAKEAKRMGILPKNLLVSDELNWVYA